MKTLILTPDIILYGKAILLTSSIGCSNIASHLHSRWFPHGNINVVLIHWIVKCIIVCWGLIFTSPLLYFKAHLLLQIVSIVPAILLGMMSVKIEYAINRWYIRSQSHQKTLQKKRYIHHHSVDNKTLGIAGTIKCQKVSLKNVHEHHARLDSEIKFYQPRDIILVAVCEEFIFRGFLFHLAYAWHNTVLIFASLFITTLLFGASHLTLGKGQFLSKTILGTFCLFGVLITHSIVPAIVIHVVFNIYAYREMRSIQNNNEK